MSTQKAIVDFEKVHLIYINTEINQESTIPLKKRLSAKSESSDSKRCSVPVKVVYRVPDQRSFFTKVGAKSLVKTSSLSLPHKAVS